MRVARNCRKLPEILRLPGTDRHRDGSVPCWRFPNPASQACPAGRPICRHREMRGHRAGKRDWHRGDLGKFQDCRTGTNCLGYALRYLITTGRRGRTVPVRRRPGAAPVGGRFRRRPAPRLAHPPPTRTRAEPPPRQAARPPNPAYSGNQAGSCRLPEDPAPSRDGLRRPVRILHASFTHVRCGRFPRTCPPRAAPFLAPRSSCSVPRDRSSRPARPFLPSRAYTW